MKTESIEIHFCGRILKIGIRRHAGANETIVYLHGLGSSGADYMTDETVEHFSHCTLVAPDFPGCGLSQENDVSGFDMLDLVEITKLVLKKLNISKFHLIGHSMGGLVGTRLANTNIDLVLSFVNIEGNLSPIDCRVFSEFICDKLNNKDAVDFYKALRNHLIGINYSEHTKFFDSLPGNTTPETMFLYSKSIVNFSHNSSLYEKFSKLTIPKAFIYGEENNDLPYLRKLRKSNISTYEIQGSNHFPFYSNNLGFIKALKDFYKNMI